MTTSEYTVYGMSLSGNCHKVKQILELSGKAYRWIETDTREKATRTPEFQAKNPNGEVPLLELPDGRLLPESNAILYFLAQGTAYWPADADAFAQAQILRWMFFEQYSHEPYIAVNRARLSIFKSESPADAGFQQRLEKGNKTLGVMDRHLAQQTFFAGDQISIADISLFAYTHVAHEGGFDLAQFPAVRAWLARLREHGFIDMPPAG